jgi:hypothetical protein
MISNAVFRQCLFAEITEMRLIKLKNSIAAGEGAPPAGHRQFPGAASKPSAAFVGRGGRRLGFPIIALVGG